MKKSRKLFVVLFFALLVSCLLLPPQETQAASKYVKSLTLSKSKVTVTAGKKATVKATVKVKSSASKYVTVKSSKTSVATVKVGKPKSGKSTITITGKKKGTATITVTTKGKNSKKKKISKKIKVTVKAASTSSSSSSSSSSSTSTTAAVSSITLDQSAVTIAPSGTVTLNATVSPSNAPQTVTWISSNGRVAAVNNGVVTGYTEGTAVITATAGTQTATCTVTVYKPFTKDDYTVTNNADKTIHIDFTATSEEVAQLYASKPGYTVSGKNVQADISCESVTYTFNRLPKDLNELKEISLDNACAPMAAMICAFHTFDSSVSSYTFATAKGNTLLPMLDYIGGKNCTLSTGSSKELMAQYLANRFCKGLGGCPYLTTCYFEGATHTNAYTPTTPYKLTMYVGPYYIEQHTMLDGTTRPTTYMVLIKMEGDDSERYIDVYHSSDGNWYALNSSPYETFKQLTGAPKDVDTSSEW